MSPRVCSCGRGFNKELLSTVVGGVEGDCLPGCPQTSPRECRLEEVKGIEVRMYKTSPIVYRNRISASAYTLMLLSNIRLLTPFTLEPSILHCLELISVTIPTEKGMRVPLYLSNIMCVCVRREI